MHELGIAQHLLDLTLQHAEAAGAVRVVRLNLVIGELSSVVDDSIQFYWELIAKGTIAEQAELHFERVPGKLRCAACGHEFYFADYTGQCPACGSDQARVVDGDQFKLESIEIEKEAPHAP